MKYYGDMIAVLSCAKGFHGEEGLDNFTQTQRVDPGWTGGSCEEFSSTERTAAVLPVKNWLP